ncbi:ABC transporter permease [Actinomadura rupiterrae]|uniref:ABC transporter permease n=1 Tax=Actinomadura rupiterrae TaxID=559627 RepID=UPI0020A50DC8|nr:ABC transporter permease [Actinomadura rupiterrae]MCP2343112.1 ABC transporter DrrB family efflux protein [Actinomadura rupiterrae]
MTALTTALGDGGTIAWRNLIKTRRNPDLIGMVVLTPIMFVLLFAYVFGNAIHIPGISYREYMMAGVFTETVAFGASLTGYGLVLDLQKGIIDRFRGLPMAPSAVLVGRTTSDLLAGVVSLAVMSAMGLVVGWRVHSGPAKALLGMLVLLMFTYALSWVMATLALSMRSPEVFSNASTMLIFPLAFVANTFVDSATMPGPLRFFAEWNPVSAVTQAARVCFGNASPNVTQHSHAWALHHPIVASVLWTAALLAVFVPLATRQYQKAVSR